MVEVLKILSQKLKCRSPAPRGENAMLRVPGGCCLCDHVFTKFGGL